MSGKHVAKDQPATFEFNAANEKRIQEILKKYPPERKKSAVMPLLDLAQRQHDNWIPNAAIKKIGEILEEHNLMKVMTNLNLRFLLEKMVIVTIVIFAELKRCAKVRKL